MHYAPSSSSPDDRGPSLPDPGNRWLAPAIVGDLQKSLAIAGQKIGCKFVGARLSGLQPIALDGLLASRPVALAGKAVWPICRQITRTDWLARYVWPTWGRAVSTCHERRIASRSDWQPDVAGKPLSVFAGKSARPIACQRGRVGWLQIARSLRAAKRPAQTTIDQRKSNASSTIARRRLNQAEDMDKKTCPQCGKILKPNRRGVFCGRRCVWRAWRQRSIARGYEAKNLPLAIPPPNSEPMLPEMGPERLRVANQLTLIAHASDDARGYRVGIQPGNQRLMRWFPPAPFARRRCSCSIRSRGRRCRCRAPTL